MLTQATSLSPRSGLSEIRTNGRESCSRPSNTYLRGVSHRDKLVLMFRPTCKQWSCPACAQRLQAWWRYVAMFYAEWLWHNAAPLTFITLTSHRKLKTEAQTIYVYRDAWPKLYRRIRREHENWDYFSVPEHHQDGRLHVHLISSDYIPLAWLKKNAPECGLGYKVDSDPVLGLGRVSNYVTKYLSKQLAIALWPKNFMRIRHSRTWSKPPQESTVEHWDFIRLDPWDSLLATKLYWERHGYQVEITTGERAWQIVDSIG